MSYHYHQQLGVREIDPDTYAAWLSAGNPKALAYTPITDPPDQYAQFDGTAWVYPPGQSPAERQAAYLDNLECTRLQGKLALIDAELWDQYEALIASLLPSMTPAQRVFVEDAQTWRFRDPVLQMFAAAIELTEAQTIALFETAKSL